MVIDEAAGREHEFARLGVLVVDDDEFMLEVVRELLTGLGVSEVRSASDAENALALIDSTTESTDVIVFDLNMYGMHGTELMRQLASRHFAGGIVLMSGSSEQLLTLAVELGRDLGLRVLASLRKPVELAQLRTALESAAADRHLRGSNS